MIRKAIVVVGAALVVFGTASPALAAGSVANSCAVVAPVEVWKKVNAYGWTIERLGCGQGTSGVWRTTVKQHPFTVKTPGRAPWCMNPGQWYYPANGGNSETAVLTPTVRCSN